LPARSEGINALSRGYNAFVRRKHAWAVVFPGKIVLRSTRVHTTMMQVPVEDVVTFAICIGGTGRQMDHGRHVPRLRPVVSEWARFAPPPSTAVHQAVCCHVGSLERLACARELLR